MMGRRNYKGLCSDHRQWGVSAVLFKLLYCNTDVWNADAPTASVTVGSRKHAGEMSLMRQLASEWIQDVTRWSFNEENSEIIFQILFNLRCHDPKYKCILTRRLWSTFWIRCTLWDRLLFYWGEWGMYGPQKLLTLDWICYNSDLI